MGSIVNPTVVIVPGAWEPAKVLEPFAELLRGIGHPTEVVPLLSVGGTETPLAGLKEDVEAVREVLTKLADEARDIVLLCHSYGGVVGSCAVGRPIIITTIVKESSLDFKMCCEYLVANFA